MSRPELRGEFHRETATTLQLAAKLHSPSQPLLNMSTFPVQRNLITFAEEEKESCTLVSVKGDATYCIKGPVCGAKGAGSTKQVSGACPAEGDAAVEHCVETSRSYSTGCVAPVDAQCVITPLDHWECVFPNITSTTAPTQPPIISSNKLALSASTESTSTTSESESLVQGPNTALNIVVGVSCCILALVGLVYVKKRRDAKKRELKTPTDYRLSPSDISIVLV
ncbi:hypothetical protein F442_20673 [Phytophthora nicotianae P10297]|uniref:Uncharacterized protein n=1 Tax=Phytophthora nicotianae P10297 TaxID=1317064 RepID=W2Y6P0_PHYNI|nr:hypothetical protein F442_20673 [Phytophthora nicotianae P10297]